MRSATGLLLVSAMFVALFGCTARPGVSSTLPEAPTPGGSFPTVGRSAMPMGPDPSHEAALVARARAVLSRWEGVLSKSASPTVVPVGDMTGQIGDWEAAVGDNNKRALMAGLIFSEGDLTMPGTPATARVAWVDGTTVSVAILGAQDALAAIEKSASAGSAGSSCDGCTPLTAVSAKLIQGRFATTRGTATGPEWAFAIRGTAVQVTRVAVSDAASLPPMNDDPGGALGIDAALGSVDGVELTVRFVGAPYPGDRACGEDYTAAAIESDAAVTVIVTRHPYTGYSGACSAVGAMRTAVATLAHPLGDRVVLDLATGLPVTVARQP